jgi:hypothetical protein
VRFSSVVGETPPPDERTLAVLRDLVARSSPAASPA